MLVLPSELTEIVLNLTPFVSSYDNKYSHTEDSISVTAICRDGKEIELDIARNEKTLSSVAPVKEQIANLDICGLVLTSRDTEERLWNCRQEEFTRMCLETHPTPNLPYGNWEAYLPIDEIDWNQVRSRFEELLRNDETAACRAAAHLGIKLW